MGALTPILCHLRFSAAAGSVGLIFGGLRAAAQGEGLIIFHGARCGKGGLIMHAWISQQKVAWM
jgi:hypothetical protein